MTNLVYTMKLIVILLTLVSSNLLGMQTITEREFAQTLKLAQDGDVNAQFEIGRYYNDKALNGDTIYVIGTDKPKNPEENYLEAARWFLKAAKNNHTGGQFFLGIFYSNGCGVIRNNIESLAWFSLAGRTNKQYREEFYEDGMKRLSTSSQEKVQKRALELQEEIEANITKKVGK
jgi:TPR repeat protein